MAYKSNGTIAIGSQRAILDASNATVELTLVAPGVNLIGKLICAIAFNIDNTTSITYDDVNGSTTHTFTQVGETVWFYGATETQWFAITDQKVTLGTYGDGRDGDMTFSSSDSIKENKFYENLTINPFIEVQAENVVVCVRNTLTMGKASYFRAYPEDAVDGTAGEALAEYWYGASGAGGAGGYDNGNGAAGESTSSSLGGSGGAGGTSPVGTPGGAGLATAPSYLPYFLDAILSGKDRDLSSFQGGAGGGGGGSGGSLRYGGGGGGGGGILCIIAKNLLLNTTSPLFIARGGNAANGAFYSGGGGAGGGGFVCVVYQSVRDLNGNQLTESQLESLIDVSAGTRGTGTITGGDGNPGSPGNTLILRHG